MRETERQTETDRQTETKTERERERERDRDRERQRQRERERNDSGKKTSRKVKQDGILELPGGEKILKVSDRKEKKN